MKKTIAWSVLMLAGSASVACGPAARMVEPGDLAGQSRVLEVANRSSATGLLVNEGFNIGDYEVAEVDRDWDSSRSAGAGLYGADKKTTGYAYQLKARDRSYNGVCASLTKGQSVAGIGFANSTNLTCECTRTGERVTIKVEGETEATGGNYKMGDKTYTVTGVKETDESYYGVQPVGYRLDNGQSVFAAVETIRPGRVWFQKDISEPEAMATTCALVGLMLYIPPNEQ